MRTSERTIRLGAVVWICAVQFFVLQAVVQLGWTTPFSLMQNFISDLGNTSCGPYPPGSGRYVCSPWHAWMNASFVLQGLIIAAGAVLVPQAFPRGIARPAGVLCLVLGGIGNVAVGVFPEDVNFTGHELGASAILILGNLGMIPLGISLARARRRFLALYSIVSGVIGLLATGLFVSGHFLGIGVGGMERVAAYALPLWLISAGVSFVSGCRIPGSV
jgi:hypothetical membrane protein